MWAQPVRKHWNGTVVRNTGPEFWPYPKEHALPSSNKPSPPRPPPPSNNNGGRAAAIANANYRRRWEPPKNMSAQNFEHQRKNAREKLSKTLKNLKEANIKSLYAEIHTKGAALEANLRKLKEAARRLQPWTSGVTVRRIDKLLNQIHEQQKIADEHFKVLSAVNAVHYSKLSHSFPGIVLGYLQDINGRLEVFRKIHGTVPNTSNIEARIKKWSNNERAAANELQRNALRKKHAANAETYLKQLNANADKKFKAATKIQAAFKGFKARRQLPSLKEAAAAETARKRKIVNNTAALHRKLQANKAAAAARKRQENNAAAAARKRQANKEAEAALMRQTINESRAFTRRVRNTEAAAARKRQENNAAAAARKRQENNAAAAARKRQENNAAAAARKRQENNAARRAKAATTIQAVFRGAKARKQIVQSVFPNKKATLKNVFARKMHERAYTELARAYKEMSKQPGYYKETPTNRGQVRSPKQAGPTTAQLVIVTPGRRT